MSQPSNGAYGDDDKIVVDPATGGINFSNLAGKMEKRYSKARQGQQKKIYKNEILGLADPDCIQGYKDLVKVAYEVIKGKDPQEQLETLDKFIKFAIGKLGASHFPAVAKAMAGGAIAAYVGWYQKEDKQKQVIPQYVLDCAIAVKTGLNPKDPQQAAKMMLHAILKGMNDFAPEALDPKDRVKIEKEKADERMPAFQTHGSEVESASSSVTGSGSGDSRDHSIEAGSQDTVKGRAESAESTDSMQSAWDDDRHAQAAKETQPQEKAKQAAKETQPPEKPKQAAKETQTQEKLKQAEKETQPQEESKVNLKSRSRWTNPFGKRG